MKLIKIPEDKYYEYRLQAMFNCYKWDPMFCDNNTLAKYVLVLTKEENEEVLQLTEKLDEETRQAEEFLNKNLRISKKLSLPKKILEKISAMQNYDESKNIRLMRYDFHPDKNNRWSVTEVNSDVPGGFAESSLLPDLARITINRPDLEYTSFGDKMVETINNKLNKKGTIMMVHCTCFSDDRQVMQYLGDRLNSEGYNIIYGAADHINFKGEQAYCILENNQKKIDLIFRFTPLEWLIQMKPRRWDGYFNTKAISCNHPIAIYAQTKRFPFVWKNLEKVGIKMETWRKLLPETVEVSESWHKEGFIYKPVYGRVGERISIKEACKGNEYEKIIKDVRKHPKQYLAQKKFESFPLMGENGQEYHVCLGSYTIEGKHAGYYARISESPRIDSYAADIPVLIEK
ncbi:MAG: glutathionylspermidine synthase family protein [Clostridia bacterium]|nr:glutathionylspermidine synthase family protein [Clostridia bacterium]